MASAEPRPGRRASPPRVKVPSPTTGKPGGNGSWTKKLQKRGKQAGANSHTLHKKEVVHSKENTEEAELPLIVRPGRVMDMTPAGKVERQKIFLETFMDRGTISAGCRAAEISHTTFYWWLDNDPNFLAAYTPAVEVVADELEESAYARAKDKSDILAIFLLKGMRHKYRDTYKGPNGNGKPEEEEEKEHTASTVVRSKLDALKRKKGGSGISPEKLQVQVQQARLRGKVRTDEDDDSDIMGEDDD